MKRFVIRLLLIVATSIHTQSAVAGYVQSASDKLQKTKLALKQQLVDKRSIKLKEAAGSIIDSMASIAPAKVADFLRTVELTNLKMDDNADIQGSREGFTLSGTAVFGNTDALVQLIGMPTEDGRINTIIQITLPDDWQFSSMVPELVSLNKVTFTTSRIVIPTANMVDKPTGILLQSTALNFIAGIGIGAAVLTNVKKFTDRLDKSYIVGGLDRLNTLISIPLNPKGTTFAIYLPVRLGINFDELYKAKKLSTPPTVIRSLSTDQIMLSVSPFELTVEGAATVRVGLVTQEEPLIFGAGIAFNPTTTTFKGWMAGKYQPAFGLSWLGLSEFGFETNTDVTIAASTLGVVPFSGVGLRGSFALGSTNIAMAAKAQVSSSQAPEFGIFGTADRIQIQFSDLYNIFVQMAREQNKQQQATWSDIPPLVFQNLALRIMPTGMEIADVRYGKGFTAQGAMSLGSFKGELYVDCSPGSLSFTAQGWLSTIDAGFFKLGGSGPDKKPGTADDGLTLSASIGLLTVPPKLPALYASGYLSVPLIGMQQEVMLDMSVKGLYGKLTNISFFNSKASQTEVRIPFSNFDDFLLSYQLDDNTMGLIKNSVRDAMNSWKATVGSGIDKARRDLQAKIDEKNREISSLEAKKNSLEADCKEKTKVKSLGDLFSDKFWSGVKDCINVGVTEIESQAHQAANDIRDASSQLVQLSGSTTAKILDGINAVVDVATALQITKVYGTITGADLKVGKMPRVTIEVTLDALGKREVRTLKDLQFDFKNPSASGQLIFESIKSFFQ